MERLLCADPDRAPPRRILDETGGVDFAHVVGHDECRFRVNLFKQRGRLSLVARRVNYQDPQLRGPRPAAEHREALPVRPGHDHPRRRHRQRQEHHHRLDARLHQRARALHILTIEDPIEYLFTDKKAVINQREVGLDVPDWHTALKHAVRQDPDIILVGEMRDRDTFEAAMHAAETGHLVFGTIHASTRRQHHQPHPRPLPRRHAPAMRQSLAFNLKAIVCQKLLPSIKPGVQRVPTNEIMIMNPTVKELIIKAEDKKLPDAIRIGYQEGMLDFTESLRQLVERGDVRPGDRLEVAPNPEASRWPSRASRWRSRASFRMIG